MNQRGLLCLAPIFLSLAGCFGSSETDQTVTRMGDEPPMDPKVATAPPKIDSGTNEWDQVAEIEPQSLDSSTAESSNQPDNRDTPTELQATDSSTAANQDTNSEFQPKLDEEAFADIPPVLPSFEGEDQPEDADIPVDIQRSLKSYDDGYVDALTKLFIYPHPKVRHEAIERVSYLGKDSEDAPKLIPHLRAALKDPNADVREQAADALQNYGELSWIAMPELLALTEDKDERVAGRAIDALGAIGPKAARVVPVLLDLAKRKGFHSRGDAIDALGNIGPDAKAAVPTLEHEIRNYGYDERAAQAIAKMGAEDALIRGLKSDEDLVRKSCARGTAYLDKHSDETVQLLVQMATDDSYEYGRQAAAKTLGIVRPTTDEIVQAIGKATTDKEESVRQAAVEAFGKIDPALETAVPFLLAASKDEEEWVRNAAARSLGNFEISPESRLNAILDQLAEGASFYSGPDTALSKSAVDFYPLLNKICQDDQESEVRRGLSIQAFGYLFTNSEFRSDERRDEVNKIARKYLSSEYAPTIRGSAALLHHYMNGADNGPSSLQSALLSGLSGGKLDNLKIDAARRLARQKVTAAIPHIIRLVQESDEEEKEEVQRNLVTSLGSFGELAADATPMLLQLQAEAKSSLKNRSINAIGEIGSHPEQTLPVMTKLLQHQDSETRGAAARTAAKIIAKHDLDANELVSQIQAKLTTEKEYGKHNYLVALTTLGPKSAPAVATIIPFLNDKYLSDDAARTLGAIGPAAEVAVPNLIDAATTWEDNRDDAIEAIGSIGKRGDLVAKVAPELLKDLAVRNDFIAALKTMGEEASPAAPAVAQILDSDDKYERHKAAELLLALKTTDETILAKLKDMAKNDPEEFVRTTVTKALQKLMPNDPDVLQASVRQVLDMNDRNVKAFVEQLEDRAQTVARGSLESPSADARRAAAMMIPHAFEDTEATKLLTSLLADSDDNVRKTAAMALSNSGRASVESIGVLLDTLTEDSDWRHRNAISRQGITAKRAVINFMLNEENSLERRIAATQILMDMGGRHVAPNSNIQKALQSDDPRTKQLAAIGLANLANDDTSHLDTLMAAAGSSDAPEQLRLLAFRAIQSLRFDDQNIPPSLADFLIESFRDSNEEIARSATNALGYRNIPEASREALIAALHNPKTQMHASSALAYNPTIAADFVAPLLEAIKSEDEDVREQAQQALQRHVPTGSQQILKFFADDQNPASARIAAGLAVANKSEARTAEATNKVAAVLSAENEQLKAAAAILLIQSEHPWEPIKESVLSSLTDQNYRVSSPTLSNLLKAPARIKESRDDLVKLLKNEDLERRRDIADVIIKLDDLTANELDALVKSYLNLAEFYERDDFAESILRSPQVRAEFVKRFSDADADTRATLLDFFSQGTDTDIEEFEVLLPELQTALASDNQRLKRNAAIAISNFSEVEREVSMAAAQALIPQLKPNEDGRVDYAVTYAVGRFGENAAAAVPALMKLLGNEGTAGAALDALGQIGKPAKVAVPKAIELLSNERVTYNANRMLRQLGPDAAEATPALTAMLDNPKYMVAASQTLGAINAPSDQVLPAIYKYLKDADRKYDAVQSLGYLKETGRPAVPVLLAALKRGDNNLTLASIGALSNLGEVATDASSELSEFVSHPQREIRIAAIRSLQHTHGDPKTCVPKLIKAMSTERVDVRSATIYALAAYESDAAPIVNQLVQTLDDKRFTSACIHGLSKIGPASAPAVGKLTIIATADPTTHSEWTRRNAVLALGNIGPAAKSALPALEELHANSKKYLKTAAAKALWQIDPATAKRLGAQEPKEES